MNLLNSPLLGLLLRLHSVLSYSIIDFYSGMPSGGTGMRQNPKPFDTLEGQFGTLLIDPPWRFSNRTGKMAPEHKRLRRYETMSFEDIAALPVGDLALPQSHLYLWCPNALIAEGLHIMQAWGFTYKTNIVWYKTRKDGGPDGRGVGFYFRNVTELLLFGIQGKLRTKKAGCTQVNILVTRKQEHSRKPDEAFDIIEQCSPGPFLELFARFKRPGWTQWGDQIEVYEESRPLHAPYNGHALNGHANGNVKGKPGRRGRPRKAQPDDQGLFRGMEPPEEGTSSR